MTTMQRLDDLFRDRVRSRGVCEARFFLGVRCWGRLETAHILPRNTYRSVRWDDDNAACLCLTHHRWFTEHPNDWTAWVTAYLGAEHFQALRVRALSAYGKPDLDAILERLSA